MNSMDAVFASYRVCDCIWVLRKSLRRGCQSDVYEMVFRPSILISMRFCSFELWYLRIQRFFSVIPNHFLLHEKGIKHLRPHWWVRSTTLFPVTVFIIIVFSICYLKGLQVRRNKKHKKHKKSWYNNLTSNLTELWCKCSVFKQWLKAAASPGF